MATPQTGLTEYGGQPMGDMSSLPPVAEPVAPEQPPVRRKQLRSTEQMMDDLTRKELSMAEEDIQAGYVPASKRIEARESYQQALDANRKEMLESHQKVLNELDPRKAIQQQAPQFADFAKQVSPIAMIMMAFGGRSLGLSGKNMMSAVTGMLQGTAEGNMQAYQAARQQYKDSLAEAEEAHRRMEEYLKMVGEYAKDNMLAKNEQAKNALALIDVKGQMAENGLNTVDAIRKSMLEARKAQQSFELQTARLQSMKDSLDLNRTKAAGRYLKEASSAKSAVTAAQDLTNELEEAKQMWSKLKADSRIKRAITANAALDSKTIDSILRTMSPEYSRLSQRLASRVGTMLVTINDGLPASALRIKATDEAELKGLIQLKGKTPAEIDQGFEDFIRRSKETSNLQNLRSSQNEAFLQSLGFGSEQQQPAAPAAANTNVLSEADAILGLN
jgi:hypothetical protein